MTWWWHHQYCQYRVWAMLCQNLVKIWAVVQKLLWFLSISMVRLEHTHRDKQHCTVSQTLSLSFVYCEDPVSFPVSMQTIRKKSHWFQTEWYPKSMRCKFITSLSLPPCNIMMGLWCVRYYETFIGSHITSMKQPWSWGGIQQECKVAYYKRTGPTF